MGLYYFFFLFVKQRKLNKQNATHQKNPCQLCCCSGIWLVWNATVENNNNNKYEIEKKREKYNNNVSKQLAHFYFCCCFFFLQLDDKIFLFFKLSPSKMISVMCFVGFSLKHFRWTQKMKISKIDNNNKLIKYFDKYIQMWPSKTHIMLDTPKLVKKKHNKTLKII